MGEEKAKREVGPQRSRGFILGLGLVALVAFLSWVALSAAARPGEPVVTLMQELAPPSEPLTLRLLHTNDTWGYTDPCG